MNKPKSRIITRNAAGAAALLFCAIASQALAFDVQSVTSRQRWPWNNLLDVDVTLANTTPGEFYRVEISATYPALAGGEVMAKTLVSEPVVTGDGTHRLVWDIGRDFPDFKTADFTVKASVAPLAATDPVYLVVDLSAGSTATTYPHRYTTRAPDLSSDVCRTTELWLRRCPAGTFTRGCNEPHVSTNNSNTRAVLPAHRVTLTKPFYIGIFELTQGQYFQMEGARPSYYANETCWATRPLENLKCNVFRPSDGWYPADTKPMGDSPMLRLRNRTGLLFDLPTDAQWEYACKAGSTGMYYYPEISYDTVKNYGRNKSLVNYTTEPGPEVDDSAATAKVGTYPANPWGLYDMYGNVAEYTPTGDPFASSGSGVWFPLPDYFAGENVDPYGPPQLWADLTDQKTADYTSSREIRGGSWMNTRAEALGSSILTRTAAGSQAKDIGFRLVVRVE